MGDHRCRNQVSRVERETGSVMDSHFFKPGVGQNIALHALPVATDVNAYELWLSTYAIKVSELKVDSGRQILCCSRDLVQCQQ